MSPRKINWKVSLFEPLWHRVYQTLFTAVSHSPSPQWIVRKNTLFVLSDSDVNV